MCMPSGQMQAPAPPPPMPAMAPPPPPPTLQAASAADGAGGQSAQGALAANRGRSSLRIDRTNTMAGGAGTPSGLNIPT